MVFIAGRKKRRLLFHFINACYLNKRLHIVCLDAPSPADYGGAIDMHYKIKALHAVGWRIILHYFSYNKSRNAKDIEELCDEVQRYDRRHFASALLRGLPYIVHSRINNTLLKNLNKNEAPVLLEGLHCTGIIPYLNNVNRVVVRMHNEEVSYYAHLVATEKSFFKKLYFQLESRRLHHYQKGLNKNVKLAVLSEKDAALFTKKYGFTNVAFVPCFTPWQAVSSQPGSGAFCLYHGNLRVAENNAAAIWLIDNVFAHTNHPFVIAGSGPSAELKKAAGMHPHITVIENPTMEQLAELIAAAHIHVLPSLNNTGVKLKLLNAALNGRFIIANKSGVEGSFLEKNVQIAEDPQEWINAINNLMAIQFSAADVTSRKSILEVYDNRRSAALLSEQW